MTERRLLKMVASVGVLVIQAGGYEIFERIFLKTVRPVKFLQSHYFWRGVFDGT